MGDTGGVVPPCPPCPRCPAERNSPLNAVTTATKITRRLTGRVLLRRLPARRAVRLPEARHAGPHCFAVAVVREAATSAPRRLSFASLEASFQRRPARLPESRRMFWNRGRGTDSFPAASEEASLVRDPAL